MKVNMLFDWKANEVELFAWCSMIFSFCIFLIAIFWDTIAGSFHFRHQVGFGWQQIVVITISFLMSFWGWRIQNEWGE